MNQNIERKLLDETTQKMNEYVRTLVRSKRVKEADSYCDEKYAQIAATGFFKKILAYFMDHDENSEIGTAVDLAGIYGFVNEKMPGRAEKANDHISIDVGEGVSLKLLISAPETLEVTVCVPARDECDTTYREEAKKIQSSGNLQIREPDGHEEKEPLLFNACKMAAFCEAAEHIYKNAHRLNEWVGLRCWRLAEKYVYLDYPKEAVLNEVPEVWWDDWLKEASEKDKSDLDFVRKLISRRGECLKYAPEVLKSDRRTVLKAIKDFSYAINYASEEFQNDKGFILEGIKKNSQLFEDIGENFRDDREIAVAAIKQRGFNYEYVSERLKRDRDIIEMVMADNVFCLRFAPSDVLDDKELAMRLVTARGDMLKYLSERLRADRDIVMAAVTARGAYAAEEYGIGGITLSYALGDLNNDREVVLTAVRYCGLALMCASDELKDDRETVRAAVENYGRALQSASARLKDDREIVFEAVKNDGTAYGFASERLRTDRELIIAAVQSAGIGIFDSFPEELYNDTEFKIFMLEAVVQCLPKFDDYGEFGDGTSEYYGIFEDHEEAFSDIVESIPTEKLKANPEIVEKICRLALAVDMDYYDEGSNPYEDSHERLPDILKEYFAENNIHTEL